MVANGELRSAVVVTGASSGIGRAIARVAARDSAIVVLVARSADGLGEAAAEVRASGGEPYTLEIDLLAVDAATHLDEFLSANGLVCDVLVNSAGYGLRGAATALPFVEQLGIVDLNIRALTELSLHFLREWWHASGGILNLSSVAGFMQGPRNLVLCQQGLSPLFGALYRTSLHWRHRYLRGAGLNHARRSDRAGSTRDPFPVLPKLDPEDVAERPGKGSNRCRLVVPDFSSADGSWLPSHLPPMLALIGRLQRSDNDPCICGSGRKFKKCCSARNSSLTRHNIGRITRDSWYSSGNRK
jgi:NAD(P)-dependent dehydrogenase (short-subunit alcohol dehydrogenase family)